MTVIIIVTIIIIIITRDVLIELKKGGGGGASAANQLENHTRALVLMPERSFRGEASHLICCLTKEGLLDEL